MFKKLKAIINHPYAAPLTETIKGIGSIALAPVGGHIEAVRNVYEGNGYMSDTDKPKLLQVYSELMGQGELTGVMTLFGFIIGGIGSAITGGVMAHGAGYGVASIVGASAAGLGIGVAAGPFALAAVAVVAAAVVGSVMGGVPGFIKGCGMVIDHIKHGKAQTQVAAALPSAQAEDAELTASLARALAVFKDLPKEQRPTYVRMMNEQHMDEVWTMNDKLLQAFDSMNTRDRSALVKGLRERLKDEFTELAKREANDSTVLQNEITVEGPLKLRKAPQATA